MSSTSTKDTVFGYCYFDISKTDKRLTRLTVKTYERTGIAVFLKLFKKANMNFSRVSLTVQDFMHLVEKPEGIRSLFTEEE